MLCTALHCNLLSRHVTVIACADSLQCCGRIKSLSLFASPSRSRYQRCQVAAVPLLTAVAIAVLPQIRKAYRKLAKENHPDKNKDDPKAEKKFQAIAEGKTTTWLPARQTPHLLIF